ncbi:DUF72 domain-containing protein [Bacillus sp. 31A1R]|uniref:DUF72 domain-containing protein n=1 Tax=Robertmurraya mangrovi TaxID=3098077 RepID=A0ABU5IYF4_9BACI|nr:DUF72 domain-containing protein [Bacillus sp. 31A1R]MDZ5472141.1 DUF72 domain-containing protein [Bacillus sp. 31A1R]
MIHIGLTGWGDHDSIYSPSSSPRNKLKDYAGFFPTVEVDASFYAVQPIRNSQRWVEDTPSTFQFIVKAYQGMTGHQRGDIPFQSREEMFQAFIESLQPYIQSNKLALVLFQFPPWFDCKKDNVDYLRWCKHQMGEIPCALEFRHQSWFRPLYMEKTIEFMKKENWIHSICDEPQSGEGSVPTVLELTNPEKVLVRFHGRNVYGWQKRNAENWREVRYLYRYNEEELMEWKTYLEILHTNCKDVFVVFNNNSGGDAADNARQLISLMGIEYVNLAPRQLDLF